MRSSRSAIAALHAVVSFPLSIFSGFVLERRYDLSRQSFRAWLTDYAKSALLAAGLGLPALLLVYYTMAHAPGWWWAIAGAIFAFLIVGLANLAPVLLLPLFFSFTPLRRQELRARLEALARRAGTRIVGVYEWAVGAKTRKANAALTGLGATRRILVSDTMLEQYTDDEIEVVLAHELGHHVYHDIWRALALETALILLGFFAADITIRALGVQVGLESLTDPAGVPLLVGAAGAVSLVLLPFGLALSRRHERRADRFALDLTSNPGAFVSAMRRLGARISPRIVRPASSSGCSTATRRSTNVWRRRARGRREPGTLKTCAPADPSSSMVRGLRLLDDELAEHVLAARVLSELAVDAERTWLVGAELERDGLLRAHALVDAIRVDGEAVCDVGARHRHFHEIVLRDFDSHRRERIFPRDDGERALALRGLLRSAGEVGGAAQRHQHQDEQNGVSPRAPASGESHRHLRRYRLRESCL